MYHFSTFATTVSWRVRFMHCEIDYTASFRLENIMQECCYLFPPILITYLILCFYAFVLLLIYFTLLNWNLSNFEQSKTKPSLAFLYFVTFLNKKKFVLCIHLFLTLKTEKNLSAGVNVIKLITYVTHAHKIYFLECTVDFHGSWLFFH
jgi:hypothetical protein